MDIKADLESIFSQANNEISKNNEIAAKSIEKGKREFKLRWVLILWRLRQELPIKSTRIRLETISLCTQTELNARRDRKASQFNAQNSIKKCNEPLITV